MKRFIAFLFMIAIAFVFMAENRYYAELRAKCGDNRTLITRILNLYK
jgi:hypothetical protein